MHIDAEYDPEYRVGSRAPFLEWYIRQSAAARAHLDCVLDVPFGPTPAETADIFPSRFPGSPVFVFIHGGYWRALSSKEFSFVATGLVANGVTVVVTNYGLCPQLSIREITTQSHAAIQWLTGSASDYNGDPGNIFVAGHSAGAQQAAMLASSSNAIKGAIAVSGIFDLRPLLRSWLQPTLRLSEEMAAEQSPLLRVPVQGPPLLISAGGNESPALIAQSVDYCEAWRKAGLDAEFFEQPGLNHYEAIYGFADPASSLSLAAARFINA